MAQQQQAAGGKSSDNDLKNSDSMKLNQQMTQLQIASQPSVNQKTRISKFESQESQFQQKRKRTQSQRQKHEQSQSRPKTMANTIQKGPSKQLFLDKGLNLSEEYFNSSSGSLKESSNHDGLCSEVIKKGKKYHYYSKDLNFIESQKTQVYPNYAQFKEKFVSILNSIHNSYDIKIGIKYINLFCTYQDQKGQKCSYYAWFIYDQKNEAEEEEKEEKEEEQEDKEVNREEQIVNIKLLKQVNQSHIIPHH